MALGHEMFIVFRVQFGLYEYMVMPFGLYNAPITFQKEINRILRPVLGLKLVIKTDVHIDDDGGMVGIGYTNDIFETTKGSLEKHHRQVSKVFQLLMDNHFCIEIDKCVFDITKTTLLGFAVSRSGLRMDPKKRKQLSTGHDQLIGWKSNNFLGYGTSTEDLFITFKE
jgi:hypothetical protein